MGRLFNEITKFDNLHRAWDEVVDKKSKPGIDGMSVEDFARHWEENMVELRREVRGNRYKPLPLLRFTMPKRDGSPRLMGKLTVRDKVVQRAVLLVLSELYEAAFLDCSLAYRPKRSVQQAIEKVVQAQVMGRGWVLHADIDSFFHKLDHGLLLRFLRETIADEPLLALITAWLNVGRPHPSRATGTPLGAVISPLLSNIYLHYLDLVMTHAIPIFRDWEVEPGRIRAAELWEMVPDWVYVRYSDDFVVLCRTQAQAELALQWVEETLSTLLLRLNQTKTVITTFKQGFEYLGCHFKGNSFYYAHKNKRIKVAGDGDWILFYRYGPKGYE